MFLFAFRRWYSATFKEKTARVILLAVLNSSRLVIGGYEQLIRSNLLWLVVPYHRVWLVVTCFNILLLDWLSLGLFNLSQFMIISSWCTCFFFFVFFLFIHLSFCLFIDFTSTVHSLLNFSMYVLHVIICN